MFKALDGGASAPAVYLIFLVWQGMTSGPP
jgi:hypothetical protein